MLDPGNEFRQRWQCVRQASIHARIVVLGWEADIQGTDQSRDTIVGPFAFSSRITYFGTVRGRLGYAPGNWLIYATGGSTGSLKPTKL